MEEKWQRSGPRVGKKARRIQTECLEAKLGTTVWAADGPAEVSRQRGHGAWQAGVYEGWLKYHDGLRATVVKCKGLSGGGGGTNRGKQSRGFLSWLLYGLRKRGWSKREKQWIRSLLVLEESGP